MTFLRIFIPQGIPIIYFHVLHEMEDKDNIGSFTFCVATEKFFWYHVLYVLYDNLESPCHLPDMFLLNNREIS